MHPINRPKKFYHYINQYQKLWLTKPASVADKSLQSGKKWIMSLNEEDLLEKSHYK